LRNRCRPRRRDLDSRGTINGMGERAGNADIAEVALALECLYNMPEAIEPYSADLVGAERKIVLGKKSGLDSITLKAQELGLEVPEAKRATVLNPVKVKGAAAGRLVTDSEFRQIVMETTR
jgi:isopropylmalate/homocitrate/citramalate synthase